MDHHGVVAGGLARAHLLLEGTVPLLSVPGHQHYPFSRFVLVGRGRLELGATVWRLGVHQDAADDY